MKLSHTAAYAVQAAAYVAHQGPDQLHTVEAIAEAHGIPRMFLSKALSPLVRAGVLRSLKGPHGGYRLARPAKEISLLEIIEAVEGPLHGNAPDVGDDSTRSLNRKLEAVCVEAAEQTRKVLATVTLADLARRATGKVGKTR